MSSARYGRYFNPLSLGRKAKPTLKHRPAIWENMLGTVYAMNDVGDIRYFDYDYDAAMDFAGLDLSSADFAAATSRRLGFTDHGLPVPVVDHDLRVARPPRRCRYGNGRNTCPEPRQNQWVLWTLKETS